MPPRKRRHNEDDDEEEEEALTEATNGVRSKRRAAVQARAKVVAEKDSEDEEDEDSEEEEDDDDDEDFNEEDEEDEDEEVEDVKGSVEKEKEGEENEDGEEEDDEDDEEVDADAVKVECNEAVLDDPTPDVPGYVLKKKEEKPQKLEIWFSEEMSETVGDITEAFNSHYESKKLPVLHVTKFDIIEERDEIFQIDVLEAKYDKAYDIRDKENDSDESNLAHTQHCLVRVDGKDGKTWSTEYFKPEEN